MRAPKRGPARCAFEARRRPTGEFDRLPRRTGQMTKIAYRRTAVDSIEIFYRETGDPKAPTVLLLHGFPTSSHMFRNLLPLLADRYHLVALDLPGFGFSDAPARARFSYTFNDLTRVVE